MFNGPMGGGGQQPGVIDPWAEQPDAANGARDFLANAPQPEAQAHRDLLGNLLGEVAGQQGSSPQMIAQQYGAPTADTNSMGLDDIVRLTVNLARQHPEIVMMVAQRFPQAQGLIGHLLGGMGGGMFGGQQPMQQGGGGLGGLGGGLLGGLLGNVLGGGDRR